MITSYTVNADSAPRAADIARSRAKADGWSQVTVTNTIAKSPREYTVTCTVTR